MVSIREPATMTQPTAGASYTAGSAKEKCKEPWEGLPLPPKGLQKKKIRTGQPDQAQGSLAPPLFLGKRDDQGATINEGD
ncbi:hypothetical protein R1flu_023742 [Riccia fluitans]|uniref:Uncharacterized protein n=1 Tax=Riccia fluitans TaxID=41844 RepID=A0ABD1XSW3_9MARC